MQTPSFAGTAGMAFIRGIYRLLISSLPGSALRTHVESLGKPRDVTSVLEALSGKLDIKRHSRDKYQLEDLKVLRRSPDLLNNVKIGQGQLQLIMEQILFLPKTFWSSDLNNLMNKPSNSPVISEKKMFR